MDEETAIINRNTRNEKIKNFFLENKKKLFSLNCSDFNYFLVIFYLMIISQKKKIEVLINIILQLLTITKIIKIKQQKH